MLTLMPLAAHSLLIDFVINSMAPFDMAYGAWLTAPSLPRMLETLTILPRRPSFSQYRPTAWHSSHEAVTFVWKTLS